MKAKTLILTLAMVLALPLMLRAQEPGDCLSCHGDKSLVKELEGGKTISLFVEQKEYLGSVHGNLTCTDCHTGITPEHPEDSPGQIDCGICHAQETETYGKSIHAEVAQADPEMAPGCISCHGTHGVKKIGAKEFKEQALAQCGECHADYLRTYYDTYHGKVVSLGYLEDMPLCWDCHAAHETRPASDPESNVSEARVMATCMYCHPDANPKFAQFKAHGDKFSLKKDPILFWTYLVMILIVCFAFGMWVPHTLLWFFRDWLEHRKQKKQPESTPPAGTGGGA